VIAHGWLISAWHPSSAAQQGREARVAAIRGTLAAISAKLDPSWLPADVIQGLLAERDTLLLELQGYGELPYNVRRDGAQRYIRKAS
jgi:hypothetical protein